jgi:hypothetical protein
MSTSYETEKTGDLRHIDSVDKGSVNVQEKLTNGTNAPAGHLPETAEEKLRNRKLNRKMDIALLPFLSLLYLFNGLDRSNVGNAETQGESSSRHC